jgi:hypothetical protein
MGENKMNGRANGSVPVGRGNAVSPEYLGSPEKCSNLVLNDLIQQNQRLEMLATALQETFGLMLRQEPECDEAKMFGANRYTWSDRK